MNCLIIRGFEVAQAILGGPDAKPRGKAGFGLIAMPEALARSAEANLHAFSVGFVLLNIAPFYLILAFLLIGAIKFGALSLNKALAVLLACLVLTYFALPVMAKKVENGAIALRKR